MQKTINHYHDMYSPDMNGKRIKAIFFPNESGLTNDNAELFMEIHGPETWVVQIENGIEVARHNTRHVETIVWEATNVE